MTRPRQRSTAKAGIQPGLPLVGEGKGRGSQGWPLTPGARQGSRWSTNFEITDATLPRKWPTAHAGNEPRSAALKADAFTARPTRRSVFGVPLWNEAKEGEGWWRWKDPVSWTWGGWAARDDRGDNRKTDFLRDCRPLGQLATWPPVCRCLAERDVRSTTRVTFPLPFTTRRNHRGRTPPELRLNDPFLSPPPPLNRWPVMDKLHSSVFAMFTLISNTTH